MKVSVFWLISGLIIHLITRGIWIGLVGLSFVWPDGVNKKRLNYEKEFDDEVKGILGLNELVLKWEKICSSIFSISFLLFMSVVGGYFFLFIFIIIPFFFIDTYDSQNRLEIYWDIYTYIIAGISVIALIDFLSFGLVKKIPYLSKVYLPITRLIRVASLAFLYRPIYYTWASQTNRWVFILTMILFIAVNFVLGDRFFDSDRVERENTNISLYFETMGYGAYSGYYEDMDEEFFSFRAQIPSDIIQGDVLRVFVALNPDIEDDIVAKCGFENVEDRWKIGASKALDCLEGAYQLSFGDSVISDVTYKFHYRQSNQQKGLITWLDISGLTEGLNELKVKLVLPEDTIRYAEIPFYKTNTP